MNKSVAISVRLTACAGVCIGGLALAQNSSNQHMDQGTQKMMSSADTTFAMKAAQGGMAEVKLGQLAVDKASNPDVKTFGQRMIDDHTKANDQLKSICSAENMTPPTDLNAKDQATYDRLSKLSGPAFDKAYIKDMVKDHQMDVKEFQKEANSGKDPQLKNFASTTLPTLQSHLQMAQSTEAKVNGGGGQ
jgi:putative membrane protein